MKRKAVALGGAGAVALALALGFQNCGSSFQNNSKSDSGTSSSASKSEVFVTLTHDTGLAIPMEFLAAKVEKVKVTISSADNPTEVFSWDRTTAGELAPTTAAVQVEPGTNRVISAWVQYNDGSSAKFFGTTTEDISDDLVSLKLKLDLQP